MISYSFDLLFEFLTILQSGTWQQYRAAVAPIVEKNFPDEVPRRLSTSLALNLAALGHVEFAFDDTLEWSVCPPAIAGSPLRGPGHGILCGARSRKLVADIESIATKRGVDFSRKNQHRTVSLIELHGHNREDLQHIAEMVGIAFVPDVAHRILRCLPSVTSMYRAAPERQEPHGFDVYRFDAEVRCDWIRVKGVECDGVYWFDSYRPEFLIVEGNLSRKVARSVAIYYALGRVGRRVVEYDADKRELRVPNRMRPPALYERALAMCRGALPSYGSISHTLTYSSIKSEFAEPILSGLLQDGA